MKFVKVDKIPGRRNRKKRLALFLEEFMTSNIKIAKVELNEGDYVSSQVRRNCIRRAIKENFYPIKATKVDDDIYLIRTDM